jgi:hypothetical protein|eukprot:SAG25_NODE_2853_length_1350_cov_1.590727_2_plen_114_part_00
MVFVHGGGYTQGCSDLYNGSELAAKRHVVVVTLNYRLGALGFWPFHEELAAGRRYGHESCTQPAVFGLALTLALTRTLTLRCLSVHRQHGIVRHFGPAVGASLGSEAGWAAGD